MKYYKKLIGEKIYLSPIHSDDAEKYVEWMADFKTTDGIGKSRDLITLKSEQEWIDKSSVTDTNMSFAIVRLDNDEMIGNCSIGRIHYVDNSAELGIFIGAEDNRDEGFGTDALQLLLDFGFNDLNLHSIYLRVADYNERAKSCYKKAGFRECGKLREAIYLNGKYYDFIYMDILRSEFSGNFIKNKNI